MNVRPTQVKDLNGKVTPAHEAVCDVCDGNIFHIAIINGHNHLICANPVCGESYCQGGCDRPNPSKETMGNAGCDKCGVKDRIPNGTICEDCKADAKCSYCGSALIDEKGECQQCGL